MTPSKCTRCKAEPGGIRLVYDKPTNRGIARYRTGPIGMRCADKEAFAVLSRGTAFVKAERVMPKSKNK